MDLITDRQKQTLRSEEGSTSANKLLVGGYLDTDISEELTVFIFNDSKVPEECHGWTGRRN